LFLAITYNDNNHIAKNKTVQVMSKTFQKDFQYEILLIDNQALSTKHMKKSYGTAMFKIYYVNIQA